MSAVPHDRKVEPLVTIGMPVYNGETHLAEALKSVLGQTYTNLEVVICDNASDDRTPEISRHFAEADPRIRYLRNPTNIGLLPNFLRVRDEARGKYFGWLDHDDLLSDPAYLGKVVAHLERNGDIALCDTWIRFVTEEDDQAPRVIEFPELHPERHWPESRRDLFCWPHDWLEMTCHGIFRRAHLSEIPIPERTRTGRPHVFNWEIDVLTSVACRARIAVLPEALRTYRSSASSTARQMGRSVSPFDVLLLDLETKLTLLLRALGASGGAADRLRLAGAALGNFTRNTFRRRFDYRFEVREAERELKALRRASGERAELLDFLHHEIQARRKLVAAGGDEIPPVGPPSHMGADPGEAPLPPGDRKPSTTPWARFFRPPSAELVRWFGGVAGQLEDWRRRCEVQLEKIRAAEGEAASLLAQLEARASMQPSDLA
ncbi:MAG TPA: glycosyltransferase family 2 protein [Actinomycetota bacterium]|nr:glycosyltransferase family 2 protein [Actinomycetota bacterium]